jgi:hypothetical protein
LQQNLLAAKYLQITKKLHHLGCFGTPESKPKQDPKIIITLRPKKKAGLGCLELFGRSESFLSKVKNRTFDKKFSFR